MSLRKKAWWSSTRDAPTTTGWSQESPSEPDRARPRKPKPPRNRGGDKVEEHHDYPSNKSRPAARRGEPLARSDRTCAVADGDGGGSRPRHAPCQSRLLPPDGQIHRTTRRKIASETPSE